MRMRMMKSKNNLLSPSSLAIHALSIGAAVWLDRAWGRRTEN